jgi:hypothetical protein
MKKFLIALLIFVTSCASDPSTFPINREKGLPTVMVTINGKQVEMIMDTGGAITVIDDDELKRLGIKDLGSDNPITGYGGEKNVSVTDQGEIKMGDVTMFGQIFTTDISYITKGTGVSGILGVEHLTSGNAQINLTNNTITLR